jgi:hypothetical protein
LARSPSPTDAATLHAAMEGVWDVWAAQVGRDDERPKLKGGDPYEDQDGEFFVGQDGSLFDCLRFQVCYGFVWCIAAGDPIRGITPKQHC